MVSGIQTDFQRLDRYFLDQENSTLGLAFEDVGVRLEIGLSFGFGRHRLANESLNLR